MTRTLSTVLYSISDSYFGLIEHVLYFFQYIRVHDEFKIISQKSASHLIPVKLEYECENAKISVFD